MKLPQMKKTEWQNVMQLHMNCRTGGNKVRFVGIDPSTKTGFVALDESGMVVRAKELTGVGDVDPKRMTTLINEIIAHIKPGDIICIEGFPYDTQRAMFAGGIHHGIRNELYKRKLKYYEIAPNAVKKYVAVTGWTGEKGSKERLTGPQKKLAVMKAVNEHYGFMHKSDNVVDAYILAKIALDLTFSLNGEFGLLPSYQNEVIQSILQPEPNKKAKKEKVKK
jgi:crossover junction endodeoxyribonuclease RuvC